MWEEWIKEIQSKCNQKTQQQEFIESAKQLYEFKENFKKAGFTEKQAFELIKVFIVANMKG